MLTCTHTHGGWGGGDLRKREICSETSSHILWAALSFCSLLPLRDFGLTGVRLFGLLLLPVFLVSVLKSPLLVFRVSYIHFSAL